MFYPDSRVDLIVRDFATDKIILNAIDIQNARFLTKDGGVHEIKGGKNTFPILAQGSNVISQVEVIFNGLSEQILNMLLPLTKLDNQQTDSFVNVDTDMNAIKLKNWIAIKEIYYISATGELETLIDTKDYTFKDEVLQINKPVNKKMLIVGINGTPESIYILEKKKAVPNFKVELKQRIKSNDQSQINFIHFIIPKVYIVNSLDWFLGNLGKNNSQIPMTFAVIEDCIDNFKIVIE